MVFNCFTSGMKVELVVLGGLYIEIRLCVTHHSSINELSVIEVNGWMSRLFLILITIKYHPVIQFCQNFHFHLKREIPSCVFCFLHKVHNFWIGDSSSLLHLWQLDRNPLWHYGVEKIGGPDKVDCNQHIDWHQERQIIVTHPTLNYA